MIRRTSPPKAVLWAYAGTLFLFLPQVLAAQPPAPPPELAVTVNDDPLNDPLTGPPSGSGLDSVWIDDEHGCDCRQGYTGCPDRWWARADYLLWWVQGNKLPPLVTTSPAQTPREQAGVLGQSGTSILFGDQRVDGDQRAGLRLTLGVWLDDDQDWGVDGHYFHVGEANGGGYQAASVGNPILARPFFNSATNAQDSQLVAFPGVVEGQLEIATSNEVTSAGVLLRRTWFRGSHGQVAFLGGYRYFRFRERLTIQEDLVVVDETSLIDYGTTIQVQDKFVVQNDFHGGEIGLAADWERGRWSLEVLTKLGLGGVHQQLDITGFTLVTVPDPPAVSRSSGGLLTRPSNMGHSSDTQFAFLPELGVSLGYGVTSSLSLRAGYSLLWLTNVLRTGEQLDLAVGDAGVPGSAPHPQASLEPGSVWAQGLTLGLEWRR